MRTQIEIADDKLAKLEAIARRKQLSTAAAIDEAVSAYVAREHDDAPTTQTAVDAAFGLWGKDGEDGLAYQERMRSEW